MMRVLYILWHAKKHVRLKKFLTIKKIKPVALVMFVEGINVSWLEFTHFLV